MLMQAIDLYRSSFVPSATLAKPRVVVGVPLVAAVTDEEAQFLASSIFQRVSGIVRGERKALQPPVAAYLESRDGQERAAIADFLAMAVIGGPATVAEHLKKIVDVTEADELMLVCDVFDPALRLRSLEIAAAAMG
jgi:alkanesulfonate monooxygenase SsuD/methylene tetrahydromethanopterin reductase-like flavin-dependent oxidoreductase (luciferase family)